MITQRELKEMIIYNPDTGEFYKMFEHDPIHRLTPHNNGLVYIIVNDERYPLRQLIWLYMTGELPEGRVYAINGDPADTRWCNLTKDRKCTHYKPRKLSTKSTSGHTGVSWIEREGMWRVSFRGKHVGRFYDIDEAVDARKAAENEDTPSFL